MRPTALLLLPLLVLTACRVEDAPAAPAEAAPEAQEAMAVPASTVAPADAPTVTVYKSPTCGCCTLWEDHLRASGFEVESVPRTDMGAVKDSLGVPSHLSSCHTAVVGDYVVEGHVPAEHVARMLEEAPAARGLAVPGMPIGSPGMEMGDRRDPYDVIVFDAAGDGAVFARVEGDPRP
jgi:hypothetical protein